MLKKRVATNHPAPPSPQRGKRSTPVSLCSKERKALALDYLIRKEQEQNRKIEKIDALATASLIQSPESSSSSVTLNETNDSIPEVPSDEDDDLYKIMESLTLKSDLEEEDDNVDGDSGDDTLKDHWLAPDEADTTKRWLTDRDTFDPSFEVSETQRHAIPEANGLKRLRYSIPIRSKDPIEQQAMIEDRAKFKKGSAEPEVAKRLLKDDDKV